ncbi:MAG TPA: DinB family protein [Candidatus Angelobacter sp.]|jgi:uncharacterized damage-inducible protein DinB
MSALNISIPAATADKEVLLALLRESREKFLGSFAGVTDEQSRVKPSADSWSVLDTVEHLILAETIQMKLVTTQRMPRTGDAPNREELFLRVVADRSRKTQSPESAQPTGRFATLADAAKQFKASRDSVIRFAEETTEDLRKTEVKHPHAAAGMVSTYEMLIIIAKHAERHAAQIEEIRKDLVDG